MGEYYLFSEALLAICGKATPCTLRPDEIFRPRAKNLYTCSVSANVVYLYFTRYDKTNIIGWIFDATNKTIECPIIVAAEAECWFNNCAGQRLVDSKKYVDNILVTDTPDHQRICIRPSDMLDAILAS